MLPVQLFADHIVVPALEALSLSAGAKRLVVGTALVETNLEAVEQRGGGPALGFFQMEPFTHNDLWTNYLPRHRNLIQALQSLSSRAGHADELKINPFYAAAMCRIKYLVAPAALPNENDLTALAKYWKHFYNTPQGKGTVEDFVTRAAAVMGL